MKTNKTKILHFSFTLLSAILLCVAVPLPIHAMSASAGNKKVYLTDGHGQVHYSINAKTSPVVKIALQLFSHDMQQLTGCAAKERNGATLQIYELDQLSNKEFSAVEKLGIPIHQFITKKDAFYIATRNGKVIVTGSDARGTAYGILELSRLAGLSPLADWFDAPAPSTSQAIGLAVGFESLQIPSVPYRGVMLDDARWLTGSNASTAARLMLRLRANMLWQDGGEQSHSYNKAVCDSFDIAIATGKKIQETEGKKHKKHKHTLHSELMLYNNNQLCLKNCTPGQLLLQMASSDTLDACIAHVRDPKLSAYQLQLVMDRAWNSNSVTPATLTRHLQSWLTTLLGERVGTPLLPIMQEYYRLTAIRHPSFMVMPFGDNEFHSGEFGNELERYLYAFNQLEDKVASLQSKVSTSQQDAYFQIVEYPIRSASLIAEKELEAQEARHIARPGLFDHDDEAKAAAALSLKAYSELQQLFQRYASLGGGKWKNLLDANDGSLQRPQLPGTLTAEEIKNYSKQAFNRKEDLKPLRAMTNTIIARNANRWQKTTGAIAPSTVPLSGHSNKAVVLPKGSSTQYAFHLLKGGDARLSIASIPPYMGTEGTQRISITLDDGEPIICSLHEAYNTSAWKQSVWRGQTLKSIFVTLGKGDHTLRLEALDDNILLDQWALDFDISRAYYVIPVD